MNITPPQVVVDMEWKPRQVTTPELDAMARDPQRLVIVADIRRIGTSLFAATLEHEYFPPVGPVNDLFQIQRVSWPSQEMCWMMIFLPMTAMMAAEKAARDQGMRFNNGVPWIGSMGNTRLYGAHRQKPAIFPAGFKVQRFPWATPNVFTLETDTKVGSAIYQNNPKADAELRRLETMQVDATIAAFREKYREYFEQRAREGRPVKNI